MLKENVGSLKEVKDEGGEIYEKREISKEIKDILLSPFVDIIIFLPFFYQWFLNFPANLS